MRIPRSLFVIVFCLLPLSRADVRNCMCDVTIPATLEARECSLCKEAEKQPDDVAFFYLKDSSPTKPNRWLTLPRIHGGHPELLTDLTAEQRTAYWMAAIAKANEIWPNETWGIALNSTTKRSQCHIHVHIGKLMAGIVDENFVVVSGPAEIPVPPDGDGVWIHPLNGRLHVHAGVTDGELNLER